MISIAQAIESAPSIAQVRFLSRQGNPGLKAPGEKVQSLRRGWTLPSCASQGLEVLVHEVSHRRPPREVSLGAYPAVPLKLARERRDEARQQLARGLNPRREKKIAREARSVVFAGVAEEWLGMMASPVQSGSGPIKSALDPETQRKHRWLVDTYLNPALGKLPVAQITAQELLALLKRIEQEGKCETAHRVRSLASRIFCYAHSTGRASQGDITASLRDALAPIVVAHAAITNPDEVGDLLLAIDGYTGLLETRCG